MCGIVIAHGIEKPANERTRLIACGKKIRHRGPDWSGCFVGQQTVLVHERLAIVGVGTSFYKVSVSFAVGLDAYSGMLFLRSFRALRHWCATSR